MERGGGRRTEEEESGAVEWKGKKGGANVSKGGGKRARKLRGRLPLQSHNTGHSQCIEQEGGAK